MVRCEVIVKKESAISADRHKTHVFLMLSDLITITREGAESDPFIFTTDACITAIQFGIEDWLL